MKIDSSFNPIIGAINSVNQKSDPFDLNIGSTEIKIAHHSVAPVTSVVGCTPGCGMTGTGNSFCCTCR